MSDEEFPFKVVRTNGQDEVLARSINLLMGRAAFETAKRLYPRDQLEYRKGAQVLDRTNRDDEQNRPAGRSCWKTLGGKLDEFIGDIS